MSEQESKTPFIDMVHKGNFQSLKDSAEKTVAEKIHNKIQEKKKDFLDKTIGR